jgi:hypothetical protein
LTITVIDVCRFEDGRIVEHWGVPDRFHQMAQLGLLPRPAAQPAWRARHDNKSDFAGALWQSVPT